MELVKALICLALVYAVFIHETVDAEESLLSSVLTPDESKPKSLKRQSRSYYDQRYGTGRPYDRLEYQRPSQCGRCDDDRYDDRADRSRDRDRYDDDRGSNHRPTYGNKYDRNGNDDDDRRYNTERRSGQKNDTDTDKEGDNKKSYDDKDRDSRPSGSRRDRDRNRDSDRYDRDRYRPDYYDRPRDIYRGRDYERPYDDDYRERRPLFDRYPPYYDRYDEGYKSRYDGYGYGGYRPAYEDRYSYDRGSALDDGYGGYGPSIGRGAHDSFRPWDETYRGQAGWDAGGRGYYFASGRPDTAPATAWNRPEYTRPDYGSGWQNVGFSGGYRDQLEYRGSLGYQDGGYRQGVSAVYSRPSASGWHNVGDRRIYRDQSGVSQLDNRNSFDQGPRGEASNQVGRSQPNPTYGTNNFGQSSSTTPENSYLFQREDQQVTTKPTETVKTS